ncbi:MAG: universal stress protein [Candidatus Sulfotelmatobacter sp.]
MTRILFDRILFATDFSPASIVALPYATAIARHFGAKIYLAYVIPPDAYDLIPVDERDPVLENIRAHAEGQMAAVRARPLLKGLSHEVLVDHGFVWPMLSAMAEKHEINLIVIGTHGRRGVEKMLLGSIAEEILRCAQCPVLMVGPESSVAPETEARLRRILYATDFSPESEPAMHYACALSKEYNAELFFLHVAEDVWQEPLSTRMQAADFFRLRLAEKRWALEEVVAPEFHVEFGVPAEFILETAIKLQIELIVLGVRGTRFPRVAAHLPGPTAYDVVSHARCPVLVIRGGPQHEKSGAHRERTGDGLKT